MSAGLRNKIKSFQHPNAPDLIVIKGYCAQVVNLRDSTIRTRTAELLVYLHQYALKNLNKAHESRLRNSSGRHWGPIAAEYWI